MNLQAIRRVSKVPGSGGGLGVPLIRAFARRVTGLADGNRPSGRLHRQVDAEPARSDYGLSRAGGEQRRHRPRGTNLEAARETGSSGEDEREMDVQDEQRECTKRSAETS